MNEVWLEIVMLAHDLIVWTQALLLSGELAKAEPKQLRYRLLHPAGRLAFSGRRAKLTYRTPGRGVPSSSLRSQSSNHSSRHRLTPVGRQIAATWLLHRGYGYFHAGTPGEWVTTPHIQV